MSRAVSRVEARFVGRIGYSEAHALQAALVEARIRGEIGDQLLLLEHPPVFTLGRSAKAHHLLNVGSIDVIETGRGGDVTYHGPGQLVGYPIVDLNPDRRDVRKYVASLEETMIQIAARYGIVASRVEGLNGAWVGERKLGAVGVRIRRWVTMHGFAINGTTRLEDFSRIVPCGIQDKAVTSIELETGASPSVRDLADHAAEIFASLYEAELDFSEGLGELVRYREEAALAAPSP